MAMASLSWSSLVLFPVFAVVIVAETMLRILALRLAFSLLFRFATCCTRVCRHVLCHSGPHILKANRKQSACCERRP